MEHDIRAFFTEHADEEVTGFAVIEAKNGQYRLAEKWNKPDGEPSWVTYWVPEAQLLQRERSGQCERSGSLTEEQFEAVCENTDVRAMEAA